MGDSCFARFLQGGGVYLYSGGVTMTSCSITGNTAVGAVRAHVQNFPLPQWDFHMFCALCLQDFLQGGGVYINSGTVTFFSCTITGNSAGTYVQAHAQNFPSPRWERPC